MKTYAGPLLVTLGYLLVYYAAITNVLRVKTRLHREGAARGEPFDRYATSDRRMLAADRVQLNMLEHMPPFLVLLWLVAAFGNTLHATVGGSLYLATRIAYPLVLGGNVGRDAPRRVMPLTFTGYAVLAAFAVELAWVAWMWTGGPAGS